MDSRKTLVTWLYKIHNKINKKLDVKEHPTLKEVWDKYESFRSKCHKSPEVVDKVKKGCVDPMSGHRKRCFIKVEDVDEKGNLFGKSKKKKEQEQPSPNSSGLNQKIIDAMDILEITNEKDVNEIRKKYRKLALIYHPDRLTGNEQKMKEINDAYETLMNFNGTSFGKSKTKGGKKTIKLISIKKSTNKGKKLMATFETNGRRKVIHFGAAGASDFTKHGDITRRNRYIFRHLKDYRTGDPSRAGYLSMFVLWNKPSLQASITDYRRRLGVYNSTGKFPTNIAGYKKGK
jgi:hypothetical protein